MYYGGNMSATNIQSQPKPTIRDLVCWFLLKEPMSQKRVQKLSYYAQAYSLAILDSDIVDKIEFEAWIHGPVCRGIRRELASFGFDNIYLDFKDKDKDQVDRIKKDIRNRFSKEKKEVLEMVWNAYRKFSANELESLTHNEEPWLEQRKGLNPFENGQGKIKRQSMKKFYGKYVTYEQ
jgi:uncharacterized phage-associated protein